LAKGKAFKKGGGESFKLENDLKNYILTISKHSYVLRTAFTSVTYALLSKLQTSYFSTLYTCFGLCWHQSLKRERLKGKWPLPFSLN
jgi:hypothetical protein